MNGLPRVEKNGHNTKQISSYQFQGEIVDWGKPLGHQGLGVCSMDNQQQKMKVLGAMRLTTASC